MESRIDIRRKDFKKCFDDPLRRRENQQVQIRKSVREEHLAKRRTAATGGNLSAPQDESGGIAAAPGGCAGGEYGNGMNELPAEICRQLVQGDAKEQYAAAQAVRHMLSTEQCPPIQTVINMGLVPVFVEFLKDNSRPDLQFESAWVLTNVASGTSAQTYAVVEAGAVPEFIRLMNAPRLDVREQAIWALGNIAGDCGELRDVVINAGGFHPLLRELEQGEKVEPRVTLLRYATWSLSNFCRGGASRAMPLNLIREALPVLRSLLYYNDVEILTDACWAISYMSDSNEGSNHQILDEIIRNSICGRLIELLSHQSYLVQTPALRAVGNIVTGDDAQTQAMINYGCIPKLKALLSSPRKPLRKEAFWALSNITAGNRNQIQEVINADIIPKIAHALTNDEFDVKREATWCLANAASGGHAEQVAAIVDAGALKPLASVLEVSDSKMVTVALEAIENILKTGKNMAVELHLSSNPYVALLEETGAFASLEKLQYIGNKCRIQTLVVRIMTTYLDIYVDNEQPAVSTGFGGMS